jgi:NTP pyrophosphatase (non-canonical NTP hydrolase)
MDFKEFQIRVNQTDILDRASSGNSEEALLLSILGLLGEGGSLSSLMKKLRRDSMTIENTQELIKRELGDVLWYVSSIATHCQLDLTSIAELGLERAEEKHGDNREEKWSPTVIGGALDSVYPDNERFPRNIVFYFKETLEGGKKKVSVSLFTADREGLEITYSTKKMPSSGGRLFRLGDELTDNATREDGYRYHDALHVGFLAVLGWSPVLRQLMGLKRKSDPMVDEVEDGARAIDIEEGISSWLASNAHLANFYLEPSNVDTETLDFLQTYTKDREVNKIPAWAWKYAICGGFRLWKCLETSRGGYAKVNLDKHSVEFSDEPPSQTTQDH